MDGKSAVKAKARFVFSIANIYATINMVQQAGTIKATRIRIKA